MDVDVGSIKRVPQKGVPPARLSKCNNISFANDQKTNFIPKICRHQKPEIRRADAHISFAGSVIDFVSCVGKC